MPDRTPDRAIIDRVVGVDRKSTRLNSSHLVISYAVFCLKKKKTVGWDTLSSISAHVARAAPAQACFHNRCHWPHALNDTHITTVPDLGPALRQPDSSHRL